MGYNGTQKDDEKSKFVFISNVTIIYNGTAENVAQKRYRILQTNARKT